MSYHSQRQSQSGHSMIEMLGVLALFVLVTWIGLSVFERVYANIITNSLEKHVMSVASARSHELMKPGTHGQNKIFVKAPHQVPTYVENGTSGTLEEFFWVALDISEKSVRKLVCEKMLSDRPQLTKSNSGLVLISVDGVVNQCSQAPQTVIYYFSKTGLGSFEGVQVNDCPHKIVPPIGGTYDTASKTISCNEGYEKHGTGCYVTCHSCMDTNNKCWNNGKCIECPAGCSTDRDCPGAQHCSSTHCCPQNFEWSDTELACLKSCTKTKDCYDTLVCDGKLCRCPTGQAYNKQYQVCCNTGLTYDPKTGVCVCIDGNCCTENQVWDPDKKVCISKECDADIDCGENQICCPENDESCLQHTCICHAAYVRDPETKKCILPCETDEDCHAKCSNDELNCSSDKRCGCDPGKKLIGCTCYNCDKGEKCNCPGDMVADGEGHCGCPEHQYLSDSPNNICTDCSEDSDSEDGENHCTCLNDQYRWLNAQNQCINTHCETDGDCYTNEQCVSHTCQCVSGAYQNEQGLCVLCPANTYVSEEKNKCLPCDTAHNYYSIEGSSQCQQCPADLVEYHDAIGSVLICPACITLMENSGISQKNSDGTDRYIQEKMTIVYKGNMTVGNDLDLGSCSLKVLGNLTVNQQKTLKTKGNITIESSKSNCITTSGGTIQARNLSIKNCSETGIHQSKNANIEVESLLIEQANKGIDISDSSLSAGNIDIKDTVYGIEGKSGSNVTVKKDLKLNTERNALYINGTVIADSINVTSTALVFGSSSEATSIYLNNTMSVTKDLHVSANTVKSTNGNWPGPAIFVYDTSTLTAQNVVVEGNASTAMHVQGSVIVGDLVKLSTSCPLNRLANDSYVGGVALNVSNGNIIAKRYEVSASLYGILTRRGQSKNASTYGIVRFHNTPHSETGITFDSSTLCYICSDKASNTSPGRVQSYTEDSKSYQCPYSETGVYYSNGNVGGYKCQPCATPGVGKCTTREQSLSH